VHNSLNVKENSEKSLRKLNLQFIENQSDNRLAGIADTFCINLTKSPKCDRMDLK
jgi:hypothetical protein